MSSTMNERVRECREKLHLSQEYVANYLSVNRATVTQIELGKRKISAEELVKFSNLFGISTDALSKGDDITMPETYFARGFGELDKKDQDEILSLIKFKKMLKEQRI